MKNYEFFILAALLAVVALSVASVAAKVVNKKPCNCGGSSAASTASSAVAPANPVSSLAATTGS